MPLTAHLRDADVPLQINDSGEPELYLRGSNSGQRGDVKLENGTIVFPDGDDPRDWNNQIVECRYLKVGQSHRARVSLLPGREG